jgi:uncharacterized membrane protein YqjE
LTPIKEADAVVRQPVHHDAQVGPDHMTESTEGLSLHELLGRLVRDVTGLFHKEIALAKAEIGERADRVLAATGMFALGAVLAVGAIGVLLAALVSGLAIALVAVGVDENVARSLSAITVSAIFGTIAWVLIANAVSAARAATKTLDRTLNALSQDVVVITETFDGKH